MAYALSAGIEVSLDGTTWYKLTDHNRQAIEITPEVIETQNRMANGSLRKYVVAKKNRISTSWTFLPTKTAETVDGNYGGAWIESFYSSNVGIPIHVKLINSRIDLDSAIGSIPDDFNFKTSVEGLRTYGAFMTSFSKTVSKRTTTADYVDISIEFTEI
jgi:hypothetical protein